MKNILPILKAEIIGCQLVLYFKHQEDFSGINIVQTGYHNHKNNNAEKLQVMPAKTSPAYPFSRFMDFDIARLPAPEPEG